jgi:hypothetical protein
MFPHSITKNAMLPRNSQVPQRSSLFLSEKNSPHDSLTRRSSDPPDHMEERALRKLYSQHQVSPKPWNQSITSPPEHSLKKHDRANHCNDSQRRPSSSKSVSPIVTILLNLTNHRRFQLRAGRLVSRVRARTRRNIHVESLALDICLLIPSM